MSLMNNKMKALVISFFGFLTISLASILPSVGASAAKIVEINASDYGYGRYVVTARGVGEQGVYDEDSVVFYYLPVAVQAEETEDENVKLTLDYVADTGEDETNGNVSSIVIRVYDENGNEITKLSPVTVEPPTTTVTLPFSDYDLPAGKYRFEVTAYDRDGEVIYQPYEFWFDYTVEEDILVPDTGNFFEQLNISRGDYLITGLIVFISVALAGTLIITKTSKKASGTNKTKRR